MFEVSLRDRVRNEETCKITKHLWLRAGTLLTGETTDGDL